MRILLVTDNHTATGGAENYFFDLKARLKKIPGIEVYSLGFGPEAASGKDFFVLKGLRSKLAKLIWQLFLHPGIYFRLRRQLKTIRPDVIHIHNVKQYTASLLKAIKPYPVVQTIHDYGVICPTAHNIHKNLQPCPTGWRLKCFWQHQAKYRPLAYLALSIAFFKTRYQLKKIVKQFFAPSPLLVEYLNANSFHPAIYIPPFKKEMATPSWDAIKPWHFFFAGNLGKHKGIYVLLEEFALAHKQEPRLTLTIAGMGPEELSIRAWITKHKLEKNICFIGWQENLEQEYRECAAIIFPSIWLEAFGLIITEAMSHARPVIGCDRGSPPWLIDDEKTGLIFNPLKKGDLAEKILKLAGNVNLISELGMKGQEKLRTFIDNEKVLENIITAYSENFTPLLPFGHLPPKGEGILN